MTAQTRPVSGPRARLWLIVAAQLLAGLVLGALLALAGSTIGAWIGVSGPAGEQVELASVIGAVVAYPLGAALGVGLVGRLLRSPGAWWGAGAGSVAGSGGLLLAAALGFQAHVYLLWGLFSGLGLVASVIGYHIARRKPVLDKAR